MIGLIIQHDSLVRVGDKIRIDCTKTFAAKGSPAITQVRIRPESAHSFIDVTGPSVNINSKNWFLDWVYESDGNKTITLEVTDSASNVVTKDSVVSVLLPQNDKTFASDTELQAYDSDILSYLPESRSSWNHVHREVRRRILAYLRDRRVFMPDGSEIPIERLLVVNELREIAAIWALKIIYWDLSNKIDDKFFQKYQETEKLLNSLLSKGDLGIDFDDDGSLSGLERVDLRSMTMNRA